jgi:hypothetical protein
MKEKIQEQENNIRKMLSEYDNYKIEGSVLARTKALCDYSRVRKECSGMKKN